MEKSEDNIITLNTDDGTMDVEVIEQTVIKGISYLLVASIENEDVSDDDSDDEDSCFILKDMSSMDSKEAKYEIVEGKEEEEVFDSFMKMLEKENIELKK